MGDGEGVGGACTGGVLWIRDVDSGRRRTGCGFSGGVCGRGEGGFLYWEVWSEWDWEKLGLCWR